MAETVETLTERLRRIVDAHRKNVARTPEKTGFRDLIDQTEEDLFVQIATVEAFGKRLDVVRVEGTEFLRVVREDGKPLQESTPVVVTRGRGTA